MGNHNAKVMVVVGLLFGKYFAEFPTLVCNIHLKNPPAKGQNVEIFI